MLRSEIRATELGRVCEAERNSPHAILPDVCALPFPARTVLESQIHKLASRGQRRIVDEAAVGCNTRVLLLDEADPAFQGCGVWNSSNDRWEEKS